MTSVAILFRVLQNFTHLLDSACPVELRNDRGTGNLTSVSEFVVDATEQVSVTRLSSSSTLTSLISCRASCQKDEWHE